MSDNFDIDFLLRDRLTGLNNNVSVTNTNSEAYRNLESEYTNEGFLTRFIDNYGESDLSLVGKYNFDTEEERLQILRKREEGIEDHFEIQWANSMLEDRIDEINNMNLKNIIATDNIFKLEDDIIFHLKPSDFLKGIQEITPISKFFFSSENIQAIDDTIRFKVYKLTDKRIDSQINNELFVIMRSIYLQYSKNTISKDVIAEVKYLNSIVVENTIHKIKNELEGFSRYIDDIESPNKIMNRPVDTSSEWRNYTYDFSKINDIPALVEK
tara:strand:+ start:33 stop:839 length:807 start_codon:yes stop_codon:yes gene_type:complete